LCHCFFFQAEDGIRDFHVTGVQTCALPILENGIVRQLRANGAEYYVNAGEIKQKGIEASIWTYILTPRHKRIIQSLSLHSAASRSEERRVGKACRTRWSPDNDADRERASVT